MAVQAEAQNRAGPHLPDPFHRVVRIGQLYKPVGYAKLLTGNVPSLIFTAGCVGVSAGLEYERFLTKAGKIGLKLGGRF